MCKNIKKITISFTFLLYVWISKKLQGKFWYHVEYHCSLKKKTYRLLERPQTSKDNCNEKKNEKEVVKHKK